MTTNKKHPSHQPEISRLNRISGQIEGIKKMIEEERYCVDILMQIKAARAAIKTVELNVLERHMTMCLNKACLSNDSDEVAAKIAELSKLIKIFG